MDALLGTPAVVLIVLSVAAALFVIEVALPTFGVAGTMSFALAVLAGAGLAHQDASWWPLLGPGLAVVLWSAMIARRQRSLAVEGLAGALFACGSVTFGLVEDSVSTAVLGLACAVIVSIGYPRLHRAAERLVNSPARVGMSSLIGEPADVVAWESETGTIRLQGTLWSAVIARQNDAPPMVGDEVDVVGFTGMTVEVANRAHRASES